MEIRYATGVREGSSFASPAFLSFLGFNGAVKLSKLGVNLTSCEGSWGPSLRDFHLLRHILPGCKGFVPEKSIMGRLHQVPSHPKQIVNRTVDGEKLLDVA